MNKTILILLLSAGLLGVQASSSAIAVDVADQTKTELINDIKNLSTKMELMLNVDLSDEIVESLKKFKAQLIKLASAYRLIGDYQQAEQAQRLNQEAELITRVTQPQPTPTSWWDKIKALFQG